ncbi:hypothetical protein HS088_TW11G00498 [Tripterygium wilfordii]|uniref:Uncharacterized protein n=1 Tax=Tripterygium wilfordii TaxID=458696 RepID=A0A7J7D2G1_TRIWF|nr:uncharacterized protein LOC120009832 [Tripterygium wilfordii]KAF5740429.1 hypothetical protein HS088_TW11G00498 [Tripterygium wilfordii]
MSTKLGYQRLRKDQGGFDDDDEKIRGSRINIVRTSRSFCRFRSLGRVKNKRRRFMRINIPSLRRFLTKKVRVVSVSCGKVVKRLKESQAHFGDLFAGNYMFVQVNPSSLKKCIQNYELSIGSLPSRVALPSTRVD